MKIETIIVGPIQSNCYIIHDEVTREGVIIDPGHRSNNIIDYIKKNKLEISNILATHGHFDHIGGVFQVKEEIGCDFSIHEEDMFFVQDAKNKAAKWGITIDQPPNPDSYLKEGEIIRSGGLEFKIIHTPGHSPGSVTFLIEDKSFVGDVLFFRSIGRTDFPMGSLEILSSSIKNKLYTLDDDTEVYTGHGPTTTIGSEKVLNPFVKI